MINAAAALPKKFGFDWWQVNPHLLHHLDASLLYYHYHCQHPHHCHRHRHCYERTSGLSPVIFIAIIVAIIIIIVVNVREARPTSSRRSTRTATVPSRLMSGSDLLTRTTRYDQ